MHKLPLLILAIVLFPTAAFAHSLPDGSTGFLHGLSHPFLGVDHISAMLAVGVFAFVLGGRALWQVPLTFVAMMVGGFLLARTGLNLPLVEPVVAVSSIVIAGAAMIGRSLLKSAAVALVGLFAVFHGFAHGSEMLAGTGGLQYALGFVTATALLHLTGIAGALGLARLTTQHGQSARG